MKIIPRLRGWLVIAHILGIGAMAVLPVLAVPAVYDFSPKSATNGVLITITGTNFSATAADNLVRFGAVAATVSSATTGKLVVTAPVGATLAPVTVTVGGLTAASSRLFVPEFKGGGPGISAASFAAPFTLATGYGSSHLLTADIDGDGRPDLAEVDGNSHTITIYQNIGTNGVLSADSFAPALIIPLPPDSFNGNPMSLRFVDLDGDGKPDLLVTELSANRISIFQNLSTPGLLTTDSFAPPISLAAGNDVRSSVAVDLDGDGRLDIVAANFGDSTISIFKNLASPGSLTTNSFAAPVNFDLPGGSQDLVACDLDGDGKSDLAVAIYGGAPGISIFRNTATLGGIDKNSLAPRVDFSGLDQCDSIATGDMDGDGKPDLVTSAIGSQAVSVFRNLSTAGVINSSSLAPRVDFATPGWAQIVTLADFDGDGRLDVAVVGELPDYLSIFPNVSTPGSFTEASLGARVDFGSGWNTWGVIGADLNGDGRPDVATVSNYDGTLMIFQNITPFAGKPHVVTQPLGQTVHAGESVSFSVSVVGSPVLSYQWALNGAKIAGATNALLTLNDIHVYQAGNYSVKMVTAYGTLTSSNALLTVLARNIVIYNYSATDKYTYAGQASALATTGRLFFLPDSTNGTFVGWKLVGKEKLYWVADFPGYNFYTTITGPAKQVLTVFGQAGQDVDYNGNPSLWSTIYKGLNTQLTIGTRKYFSFPNSFAGATTEIYPTFIGNATYSVLHEVSSSYVFAAQMTQQANNGGQTETDLFNALIKSLVGQGYRNSSY